MKSGPKIAVIGSINMDLFVRCHTLPMPGETLLANSSTEICGGKGANQAVAAARAGGQVTMIGRVGDDAFADRLAANLEQARIQTDYVLHTNDCAQLSTATFCTSAFELPSLGRNRWVRRRLGLDHTKLTYHSQGGDFRLTDVGGHVIDQLLA